MTQYRKPQLSIPQQIVGSDRVGSWAYNTIAKRLSAIARKIVPENDFPPAIVENIERLAEDLPEGKVRSLSDREAPDFADWEQYSEPYQGKRWLDVPWFFAETYFYRRVLEATGYFQSDTEGYKVDPFALQKRLGIETSMASIAALSARLNKLQGDWNQADFIALVHVALWGNRVDLSLWGAEQGDRSSIDADLEKDYLLVDDTPIVADRLSQTRGDRIDFIIDNAGFELFCDLCLADFLLSSEIVSQVRFHLKAHPTFVSDAMRKDVRYTIDILAAHSDREVKALGDRLKNRITAGHLILQENLFWTSPLVGWEMPEPLRKELAESNLIIIKGDANYRRLLGDCHWDFTTPFKEITSYFPAPLVALRTMKAELACGLKLKQTEELFREDPEWLTNGKRGVIQFAVPQ